MRRSTLLSIGAGLATAAILMVLLWFSVGRAYDLSEGPLARADMTMVGLLSLSTLLPDLLALSFAAGFIVGLVPPGRRLQSAPARAFVTALGFGAIFMLASVLLRAPGWPGLPFVFALLAGSAFFGSIGAAIPSLAAAVGAEAGSKLRDRPAHLRIRLTVGVLAAAIGVISFHGALVRLSLGHGKSNLRAAQQLVKLNLADPPKTARFIPLLSRDYHPKVVGYRQDLMDGDLTVRLDKGGRLNSANLFLVSPNGSNVSRTLLIQMEKRYHVNPKFVAGMKQEWSAQIGPYRVDVASAYPSSDMD